MKIKEMQIGFIITALFLLIISYIPYNSSVRVLKEKQFVEIIIDEVSCKSYRSTSTVYFYYKEKQYHTKILGKSCEILNDGDKYKLLYDMKTDEFRDYNQALLVKNRLIYYVIFFIMTLIPYNFIWRKFKY